MMDRKRLTTFAFAFVVFSALYAGLAFVTGGLPGLFVPSVFFFLSWFIGQTLAESLYLRDPARWLRAAAIIGAVVCSALGLGFLFAVGAAPTPGRAILEFVAGFAAVWIGVRRGG